MKKEVNRRLRDFAMQGGQIAALDAVELISAGMGERCTATVGILSEPELRAARIMQRDGISREAALERITAQKPDSYYKTHCTHILFNNADREGFAAACVAAAERMEPLRVFFNDALSGVHRNPLEVSDWD